MLDAADFGRNPLAALVTGIGIRATAGRACFTESDACGVDALHGDVARFIFVLGGSDGEGLFSPRASPD